MRLRAAAATLAGFVALASCPATAEIRAHISKSSQTMHVYVDGYLAHVWPVSTGAKGYGTPSGSYRAQRLEKRWFSTKYDNAPMHNAVFFNGGYAIHGTSYVSHAWPASVARLRAPAPKQCGRVLSSCSTAWPQ